MTLDTGVTLVGLAAIQQAARRIDGVARRTPVLPLSSHAGWRHLQVKCENLQAAGAFKLRGAYNFLAQLPPEVRARGVVTYSSGNHGQGLAFAGRALGTPVVVVMPTSAPAVKVEGARAYGAEVVFAGTTSLHRRAAAEALETERGLTMVPPFDHEHIVAGQGTIGLELIAQCPDVTHVYAPVGGGGMIAGVSAAIRAMAPHVRVIGVEPAGAPKVSRSLAAHMPITLEHSDSIADGLLALRPGTITFAHIQALVDQVVTVTEDEIRAATRLLARDTKIVAEPSGAVSVAGALRLAPQGSAGSHVAVISGGNVDLRLFAEIVAGIGE
jgi:threonine dehydratase